MNAVDKIKSYPPGAYYFDSDMTLEQLSAEAASVDFKVFYIDGSTVRSKQDFLAACKEAMQFPFFGYNWDALIDCLLDMTWHSAAGFIIVYDDFKPLARGDSKAFAVALDIMSREPIRRNEFNVPPMYFLLKGDQSFLPETVSSLSLTDQ